VGVVGNVGVDSDIGLGVGLVPIAEVAVIVVVVVGEAPTAAVADFEEDKEDETGMIELNLLPSPPTLELAFNFFSSSTCT